MSRSRLHSTLLVLAFLFCLLRFPYLRADFPNHSAWLTDQAKFTDEGWWANGAVRRLVIGHWRIPGDYNPAIVVPVWPLLLGALFHITGVSLVAARAASVAFSVATVLLVYVLTRRYSDAVTAATAALLLAASPFAFAFGRLATLDTVLVFEFCCMLSLASLIKQERIWPLAALGALIPITLLTKTTALVLLPAVFWLIWTSASKHRFRAVLLPAVIAGTAMGAYLWAVLHSRYADDYHYFFNINALADVDLSLTGSYFWQLLQHGLWVDRVLYPTALVVLLLSFTWLRGLWRNPLYTAAWLAIAGQVIFVLRRQDDYAPRYFLPMLVPMIWVAVLALHALRERSSRFAWVLAAVVAACLALDGTQVLQFLHTRQYQYWDAAQAIREIVEKDTTVPDLLLGTSADQLSLMTGLPAINDGYTLQVLHEKLRTNPPGWYVGWNDLDQDILAELAAYRLEKVAVYHVFDRKVRNLLTLYRMEPVKVDP